MTISEMRRINVTKISGFSSVRVNSFVFTLTTEESWPLLTLKLVSKVVCVMSIMAECTFLFHNNKFFSCRPSGKVPCDLPAQS